MSALQEGEPVALVFVVARELEVLACYECGRKARLAARCALRSRGGAWSIKAVRSLPTPYAAAAVWQIQRATLPIARALHARMQNATVAPLLSLKAELLPLRLQWQRCACNMVYATCLHHARAGASTRSQRAHYKAQNSDLPAIRCSLT